MTAWGRTALATAFLVLAFTGQTRAQTRPYIGYAYPAGGQQGTTVRVRLGGQGLDDLSGVVVTGAGVHAQVVEYLRRLGFEDTQLLREQIEELRAADPRQSFYTFSSSLPKLGITEVERRELIERIEKRLAEMVSQPACQSIATLATVEVHIDPGAPPGPREIRLVTPRGISNALTFHVGQLPEVLRKPMQTATVQTLGKEEQALRKRPGDEYEQTVTLPCTLNGQVASGEVNRYRFSAKKGQRLVISTAARELIPYIADAVPGWFQPVLALYDREGHEVAYNDDFRFKPDPLILFEVPRDGEYLLDINDALYRGREDFVYRISLGELPYITSIFPLGTRAGTSPKIEAKGWNLGSSPIAFPGVDSRPGNHSLLARQGELLSNAVPFVVDTLPETTEIEGTAAQQVSVPVIVNGRIDQPGDVDEFTFQGKAGQALVAEVMARRLDSPLDSVLRLFDPGGRLVAFNDDHADAGSGVNTHHADSYLLVRLVSDGLYRLQITDAASAGGEAHGYRLRISPPRPDFQLWVVPSSLSIRIKDTATLTVVAIRKDGFVGPIRLGLSDPPTGFAAAPVTLASGVSSAQLTVRTTLETRRDPVLLQVQGSALVGGDTVTKAAVPAEDRMQAFLWRHLVPAEDLRVVVFDPQYEPPLKRPIRAKPPAP